MSNTSSLRPNLLAELARHPLLGDGAMGTQLINRGLTSGACGEQWNVTQAALVRQVHEAYRAAGCDLITANTFGGSRAALLRHGLDGEVSSLNQAGAVLAQEAIAATSGATSKVTSGGWVLGDIGPFGGFLEPVGDMSEANLRAIFVEQAQALKAGGADAVIIETMVDPAELAVAVRAAKQVADWPVIATYAFNHSADAAVFRTIMGTPVDEAVARALAAGADVVGANCGTSLSLEDYQRLTQLLVQAAGRTPVIVQPNAGSPRMIDGKLYYPAKPTDMAAAVPALLDLGARIIGGCCGTSPEHLAAMAKVIKK